MRMPENYDPHLSDIIDAHTDQGIVPGWYAVNYLNIAKDFEPFFQQQSCAPKHILDLGGRSLPYLQSLKPAQVSAIDPRTKYTNAAKQLYGDVVLHSSGADIDLSHIDIILINFELGGLRNNNIPADFNKLFTRGLPVFGYHYIMPNPHEYGLYLMNDGETYDSEQQKKWQKDITNHMHMGIETYELDYITLYDLSRTY